MGASTPHFALQLRNRIRKLIAGLAVDDPARLLGEQEIARLERLGFSGEVRGEQGSDAQRSLRSVGEDELSGTSTPRRSTSAAPAGANVNTGWVGAVAGAVLVAGGSHQRRLREPRRRGREPSTSRARAVDSRAGATNVARRARSPPGATFVSPGRINVDAALPADRRAPPTFFASPHAVNVGSACRPPRFRRSQQVRPAPYPAAVDVRAPRRLDRDSPPRPAPAERLPVRQPLPPRPAVRGGRRDACGGPACAPAATRCAKSSATTTCRASSACGPSPAWIRANQARIVPASSRICTEFVTSAGSRCARL